MNFGMEAPEKSGYKFNEVTSLTGVKPYVLRFWETEFSQINPSVNESGHKVYGKSDLAAVKKVKKLLFEDKLSIPQARAFLDKELADEDLADEDSRSDNDSGEIAARSKELSKELKEALEDIVSSGPRASEDRAETSEESFVYKTSPLASRIKREVKTRERSFSDSDVVNLVSAKKKLTKLLGVVEELEKKRGWT